MNEIKDLNELWSILTDILLDIDGVCKENKLRYFLAGGTLLGAIRHKGFIPWDNDVDISMPREDYKKLIQVYENMPSSRRFGIIKMQKGSNYSCPFIKIIDKRTVLIDKARKTKTENSGVYVDVFPIDGFGDDYEEAKRLLLRYYSLGWNYALSKTKWTEYLLSNLRYEIRHVINKARFSLKGIDSLFDQLSDELSKMSFDSSKYVASTFGLRKEKEIILQSCFADSIDVPFEGHSFKAPVGYDQYLRQMYGDYMKLPPVENRVPNHDIVAYWKD